MSNLILNLKTRTLTETWFESMSDPNNGEFETEVQLSETTKIGDVNHLMIVVEHFLNRVKCVNWDRKHRKNMSASKYADAYTLIK